VFVHFYYLLVVPQICDLKAGFFQKRGQPLILA